MPAIRSLLLALGASLTLAACGPSYVQTVAPLQGEELYREAMRQFEDEDWQNAIHALERLSRELPARDSLLPAVYYHLGEAHARRDEHLLAAQSFQRIQEGFPNDTLADDGLLRAGESYAEMWRRTSLDPAYGHTALTTFQTLLAIYPNTDVREEAQRAIQELMERLAKKDYDVGVGYMRRGANLSALIYFEDVVERYPQTAMARRARLRMVEAYRRENFTADAREACEALRAEFPDDAEVREVCGTVPPPVVVP